MTGKYGFSKIHSRPISDEMTDYRASVLFYRRSGVNSTTEKDEDGIQNVRRYIELCNKKLQQLDEEIKTIVESKEELVVWGAGSFTFKLLATTGLTEANIRAFIDSDKSIQGSTLQGVKIVGPEFFLTSGYRGTVLVASVVYGDEIENTLKNRFQYTGKVVRP